MRRSFLFTALGILALAATSPAAQAKTPEVWMAGQLERVDPATQTFVVKQGAHEMTFLIAPKAQVMQGKNPLASRDLPADIGRNVKVRYTKNATTNTADRIEVSNPNPNQPAKSQAKS